MSGLRETVQYFLGQREEYVRVLKQCVEADSDYYRWQGHAEARRQLGQSLERDGVDLTVEPAPVANRERVVEVLAHGGRTPHLAAQQADALLAAGVIRDEATVKAEALNWAADELAKASADWATPTRMQDIPEGWDAHHLIVRGANENALRNASNTLRAAAKAGEPS